MSDNIERLKCVIIGSGPAGYTAAIYAARADMKPVMYTGLEMGGQLTTTTEVDNFPGYPQGVEGPKLMEDLKAQAERFETDVRFGMVTKVDFKKDHGGLHILEIDGSKKIEAETVIIATGASAKYLGIPSEQRLRGGGVSACATCDGFFYRGQDIIVVGGGDTAAEEATYLSKICNKVTLLIRRDELRASKAMQNRVFNTPNIEVLFHTEIDEVLGEKTVEGVRVINNQTNEKKDIPVTGVFIAIGHKPNTELFEGILEMDANKYLVTQGKSSKTNIPGVFACGDVQDHEYRQAVTAAGSGCMAALDAERYLSTID
jgi:thioredoxin reductase (NADPH)